MALEFLKQSLENDYDYGEQDLLIINRATQKGAYRTEVWTKRGFAPYELVFLPLTSQLKASHLTTNASVQVTIPKHGWAAGTQSQPHVGLDGRGRKVIMPPNQGGAGPEGFKGCLFWACTRSLNIKEVNMRIENVLWSSTFQASIAGAKKKRKLEVKWPSQDLPQIPTLVNPQGIAKNTCLVAFANDCKDETEKSEKQKVLVD